MPRRFPCTACGRLLLGLLAVLGIGQSHAQENQEKQLRSPQATVRALLTAITLSRGVPHRIEEAAACLDLSALPADHQNSAGVLAIELEAILRASDVDSSLIPTDVKEGVYVLPDRHGARIALARMPDGRWLFDRETVAQIPKLFAESQKRREERNRGAAALNVSVDFASPRATMRTLIEAYRHGNFQRVLACLDLSDIPTVAREELGLQLGNKLKQVVMRHRLPILQEIPDSNYSDPYVYLSQPEGVIEVVRLPAGDRKGEWVFSADTIRSIDKVYALYEDKPYLDAVIALGVTKHLPSFSGESELWLRSHLPAWWRAPVVSTRTFSVQTYELLGYLLVPALAYGLHRLFVFLMAACVRGLFVQRGWAVPRATIAARLRPAGRFAAVLFLRWGLLLIGPDRVLLLPMLFMLNPLIWLLGMWAIFRLIDLIGDGMEAHLAADGRRPEITQMLWPVGSLALKIVLFVATLLHLMTMFSWDMTAVLTGLGIGGLAFALGAQDALKNLFGSFTLIADRPFVVGENVKIGDKDIGVVEVVGLRSTRIRTADDTLLIVPNSNLTTLNVTNYGRRRYRRYETRLGIAYATSPERLIAFRDGIRAAILRQECTRKSHFDVAVNDLAASAIEILVNVYFEVVDRAQELAARDALILEILRVAQEFHVELAFPTQTIHLVPRADPAAQTLPLETDYADRALD